MASADCDKINVRVCMCVCVLQEWWEMLRWGRCTLQILMTGTTRLTLWRQALPSKKFVFNAKTFFLFFYVLILKCAEQVQALRQIPEVLPAV